MGRCSSPTNSYQHWSRFAALSVQRHDASSCASTDKAPPPHTQAQVSNADARELLLLSRTINQTVGDAISGMLLVEAVLRCGGKVWSNRCGLHADPKEDTGR